MTELSYESRLIEYIRKLDSRGYAVLRRATTESKPHDYVPAFAYLEPFLVQHKESPAYEFHLRRCVYLVASLYCLVNRPGQEHSSDDASKNLGYTFGCFHRKKYPEKTSQPTSLEQRFLVLLDSDEAQRAYFLRQLLMLLKTEPVSWERLLKDLRDWNDKTRQQWASQFYQNY